MSDPIRRGLADAEAAAKQGQAKVAGEKRQKAISQKAEFAIKRDRLLPVYNALRPYRKRLLRVELGPWQNILNRNKSTGNEDVVVLQKFIQIGRGLIRMKSPSSSATVISWQQDRYIVAEMDDDDDFGWREIGKVVRWEGEDLDALLEYIGRNQLPSLLTKVVSNW